MHAILQYKWYIKLQQELYVKWVTYNTSKLLSQGKIVQCAKKNISGKPETMKKCNDTIIATPTWQDWIKQIFTNEIFGRCTCKKETFCAQMCRIAQSDMWHEKTTGRTTKVLTVVPLNATHWGAKNRTKIWIGGMHRSQIPFAKKMCT